MKKINILLRGGLGNQLFTYAALKTILKKKKFYLYFYKFSFLSFFNSNENFFDLGIILKNKIIYKKFIFDIFEKIYIFIKFFLLTNVINDNSIIKNINKNQINIDVSIFGYFQKKKWYEHTYKDVSRELIRSVSSKYLKNTKFNDVVLSTNSYDDVVKNGRLLKHNYYLKSLKKLKIRKKSQILIIGLYTNANYINKLSSFLKKKGYKNCISYENLNLKNINLLNNYEKSIFDFFTIAKSRKLVMSNSTFCWWGSVTRECFQLNSIDVISPKKYTNDKDKQYNNPGNPNLKWTYIDNKFI